MTWDLAVKFRSLYNWVYVWNKLKDMVCSQHFMVCNQHSLFLHGSFSNCFTNESSGSGGACQWLSSWWWCILKNEIWGHSGADPAPMYKRGLGVRTFDRFRITLIMWNWKLLIESKSPTNTNTCWENSAPIGNACLRKGKEKSHVDLWTPVLLPANRLFFNIVSSKRYSRLRSSTNSLPVELPQMRKEKATNKKSPQRTAIGVSLIGLRIQMCSGQEWNASLLTFIRKFLERTDWKRKTRHTYDRHHLVGWELGLNKTMEREQTRWDLGAPRPLCLLVYVTSLWHAPPCMPSMMDSPGLWAQQTSLSLSRHSLR